jgi:hypothetical protein
MIQRVLKTNELVGGKRDNYILPLVIKNEHPYLGACALSFTIVNIPKLTEEIWATAWTIDDVRKAHSSLKLAILVKPPRPDDTKVNQIFHKWKSIFKDLKSDFVEENRIEKWAINVAQELPARIIEH